MNKEQRDQLISEVCDAMEEGKATTDDLWDAIFPTLAWCEHELKQLGFHGNYDELCQVPRPKGRGLFGSYPQQARCNNGFLVSQRMASHTSPRRAQAALCNMFNAALWSRSSFKPQNGQWNTRSDNFSLIGDF